MDETSADRPDPAPGPAPAAPDADEQTDPFADTLNPAMATSIPAIQDPHARPTVRPGDVHGGRYRLEEQLAERGGILTWRAFDQKLSRSVLIHVLTQDDPRTPDVLDAARKAAFATDSRFLRVLDAVVGEGPDDPSLVVCEFAPGESLEKLLRQGPLSALEAAWVARELADAMQSMHAEGLFHQRINPDTVVITSTGNVKIVGFLIEAAMYPDAEEGTLAWSEREQADVTAIGKVLYASLVTRWPMPREQVMGPDGQPRRMWGLGPAPMDSRGWLTPRQVRSGVSPALDIICDQVLSNAPRHNEMPLRTANQLATALSKVLGTADGAADLERRMRYPVVPAAPEDDLGDTEQFSAVDESTVRPFTPVPAPQGSAASPTSGDDGFEARSPSTPPAPAAAPAPAPAPARRRPAMQQSRPPRRRWLVILVGLVALVLLVSLVRVALRKEGAVTFPGTDEQPATWQVSSVDDFDPEGDGGNAEENPNEVKLATDGDPKTAWHTLSYLNDPRFGKLKPGVGLVVDLGQKRSIGTVRVTLQGQPTGLELRLPKDTSAEKAPMDSQKSWATVASNPKAGTSVELKPQQSVESRYVMVYVTSLPKQTGNKYRAGIAEVEVAP